MLVDRELKERREKRKRDKERARLTAGDHFVSDNDSLGQSEDEESDFDTSDSNEDEEYGEFESYSPTMSNKKSMTAKSRFSDMNTEGRFNPLRFLAFSLQQQTENY